MSVKNWKSVTDISCSCDKTLRLIILNRGVNFGFWFWAFGLTFRIERKLAQFNAWPRQYAYTVRRPYKAIIYIGLHIRRLRGRRGVRFAVLTPQNTLSVIGVGVRLAVCLKGAKIEKSLFWGYVISTLPKLKKMLEGLQVDLRTKFGPLSAL